MKLSQLVPPINSADFNQKKKTNNLLHISYHILYSVNRKYFIN